MKKVIFSLILLMFSLVFFNGCGQALGDMSAKQVGQLLEQISNNPLAMKFEVDPENIAVKTKSKYFIITLKNPVINMDLTALLKATVQEQAQSLPEMILPMNMKEMVLLHNPARKFLAIRSITGLDSKWQSKESGTEFLLKMVVENLNFGEYNISSFLDAKPDQDIKPFLLQLISDNGTNKGSMHGASYTFELPSLPKPGLMEVKIGEVTWDQKIAMELVKDYLMEESPKIGLKELLSQGDSLINGQATIKDFNFKILEDGKQLGSGSMADTTLGFFLKPDQEKKFFIYSFHWDLTELKIDSPRRKLVQTLGTMKKLKLEFALEHLTPELVQAYFDLQKHRMEKQPDRDEAIRREGVQAMQLFGQFGSSQPVLALSISPLINPFGEMQADARFQFKAMNVYPGKADVRIKNLDQVLEKLKADNFIPAEFIKKLQSFFVKDDKGDGVITFEIKEDQPGVFLLNGQPIKM